MVGGRETIAFSKVLLEMCGLLAVCLLGCERMKHGVSDQEHFVQNLNVLHVAALPAAALWHVPAAAFPTLTLHFTIVALVQQAIKVEFDLISGLAPS